MSKKRKELVNEEEEEEHRCHHQKPISPTNVNAVIIWVVVQRVVCAADAMADLLYPRGLLIAPELIIALTNLVKLVHSILAELVEGFSAANPQRRSKCHAVCLYLIGVAEQALEGVHAVTARKQPYEVIPTLTFCMRNAHCVVAMLLEREAQTKTTSLQTKKRPYLRTP